MQGTDALHGLNGAINYKQLNIQTNEKNKLNIGWINKRALMGTNQVVPFLRLSPRLLEYDTIIACINSKMTS